MILGLDISTSITGFCIMDGDGEIIRADVWDTRNKNKFETFFDKIQFVKDGLQEQQVQYPIQRIYIEQPFMFFGSGGSTAKTMAALQKFNGTVSWICYEIFKQQPIYFTAQQARKLNEIKVQKGEDTKKQILKWVLDTHPDFNVQYTHKGNPKPKYFDIADAIVIAKAGLV